MPEIVLQLVLRSLDQEVPNLFRNGVTNSAKYKSEIVVDPISEFFNEIFVACFMAMVGPFKAARAVSLALVVARPVCSL